MHPTSPYRYKAPANLPCKLPFIGPSRHEMELEEELEDLVIHGTPIQTLSLHIHLDEQGRVVRTDIMQDNIARRIVYV